MYFTLSLKIIFRKQKNKELFLNHSIQTHNFLWQKRRI